MLLTAGPEVSGVASGGGGGSDTAATWLGGGEKLGKAGKEPLGAGGSGIDVEGPGVGMASTLKKRNPVLKGNRLHSFVSGYETHFGGNCILGIAIASWL